MPTPTEELLMDALWQCYVATGADTDGDTKWHCMPKDAARSAVTAVLQLRNDYDEANE